MNDNDDKNLNTNDNLPVEEAGQIEAPENKKLDVGSEKIEKEVGDLKLEEDQTSNLQSQNPDSNLQHPTSNEKSLPHEDETERDKPAPAAEPVNDDSPGRWYVVHTYSGHENKVASTLKQRIESEHLEDKIIDVLVPMQDKIEIKGGKRLEVKEKIFPGYILVKMILDDNTWLAVRTTQGVTSFVGIGNKPTPIPESEVQTIVKFTQIQHPTFKQIFAVDDTIKIVDGPFSDFIGKIESVDEEKGKVRVLVSIFGRETPVELDFLQVQKI